MNANDLYEKLVECGEDWADKQAAANILEDTKSTVLARLMMSVMATSVAAKEMEAKASAAYELHIINTANANKSALIAKIKYESVRTWVDLKRTEAANERAILRGVA